MSKEAELFPDGILYVSHEMASIGLLEMRPGLYFLVHFAPVSLCLYSCPEIRS